MKPSLIMSSSTRNRVEKKTKVIWTKDLHNKFLEAIGKLGIDKAVPKKIVELMKVEGLTRDHVASHLQKYRILSKKIANANYGVQTALKPSLLESSMTNGSSWSHSSLMLNQEPMNWSSCEMHPISPLILDTSSSYFHGFDASNFNATNNGYIMQEMTNNLDEKRSFIDNATNSGVVNLVNSSNSGFVRNLGASFFDDYDGYSTQVQRHNNFEKGSAGCVQYSSNLSFVQNPNGFQISDYSSQNEIVEMGLLYGDSNNNLEKEFGEDDMILSEVDIGYLLSFADDYNLPVTRHPLNQDSNKQNSPNMVSVYSNYQEHASINQQQNLNAYLPDQHKDEQFMEPVWSPDMLQLIRQLNG